MERLKLRRQGKHNPSGSKAPAVIYYFKKTLGPSPVCCSRSENKAAGRGVKVGVGVPDESATTPHDQSVSIVPGFDLIFTFENT